METFLKIFQTFPKPKTAKIIKFLLEQGSKIQGKVDWQITWCIRLIQWCKEEKRTFLRQRIELRLINLYWQVVRLILVEMLYFIFGYHEQRKLEILWIY